MAAAPLIVGATLAGGGVCAWLLTWMRKPGSCATAFESLTSMVIMSDMPTLASAGVPVSAPVRGSNVAQDGTPDAMKVSESPSGSAAVGVNEYEEPAASAVGGEPAMMGGALVEPLAVDSPPPQPARAAVTAQSKTSCLPQIRMVGPVQNTLEYRGVSAAETFGMTAGAGG